MADQAVEAPTTQLRPQREAELVVDEPITGIVLAGGESKRMGRDKAFTALAGRPMIAWVLDVLREVSDHQLIVARSPARFEELDVPVVIDRLPVPGPLTGIHAGLQETTTDLNLTLACDMPLARPALLRFLAGAVGATHAAVPYVAEGPPPQPGDFTTAREAGLQPLCAAYRRACLLPLEKLLRGAEPVPTTALLATIKAQLIGPGRWQAHDPDGRSFFNVNTPEDLVAAARILSGSERA